MSAYRKVEIINIEDGEISPQQDIYRPLHGVANANVVTDEEDGFLSNLQFDGSDADDDVQELTAEQYQVRLARAGIPERTSRSEHSSSRSYESPSASSILPNDSIAPPLVLVDRCVWQGKILHSGCAVELADDRSNCSGRGDILKVRQIVQNLQTDEFTLRGLRLRRNSRLHAMLKHSVNEVCLIPKTDVEGERHFLTAGVENVSLKQIVRKRKLLFTHLEYPEMAAPEPRDVHEGLLVCRYVCISVHKSGYKKKSVQGVLRRLTKTEAADLGQPHAPSGPGSSISKPRLPPSQQRRGDCRDEPGSTSSEAQSLVDLTTDLALDEITDVEQRQGSTLREPTVSNEQFFTSGTDSSSYGHFGLIQARAKPKLRRKRHRYTFADVCCGCGGASCAARMAGLKIEWALDNNETACKSYRTNFPGAIIHHAPVEELRVFAEDLHVDIMHISLPCQPYSPAHTIPGRMDEKNEALLFTVGELIAKVRPRICTLEQTFGLFHHHPQFFYALIGIIVAQGYSVSWTVANFADHSLVHPRRRLVIFASAPGIPLPSFPKPTHGDPAMGLQRFTSVDDVLARIPSNASHHNISETRPRNVQSYDGRTHQLAGCITTSGGTSVHPSGKRTFTVRELASFQSLPHDFEFVGGKTAILRQIGNAVPPVPFSQFLRECIRTLEEVDSHTSPTHRSPTSTPREARPSSSSVTQSRRQTPRQRPFFDLTMQEDTEFGDLSSTALPVRRRRKRSRSPPSRTLSPESSSSSTSRWSGQAFKGKSSSAIDSPRSSKFVTDPRGKRRALFRPDVINLDDLD